MCISRPNRQPSAFHFIRDCARRISICHASAYRRSASREWLKRLTAGIVIECALQLSGTLKAQEIKPLAHPDIPRGIDAQELIYMKQMGNMEVIDVLRAATSRAGQQLKLPLLGTLQLGAPADMIAVKGDPTKNLKALEYPDLVISGGKIVVNNFEK